MAVAARRLEPLGIGVVERTDETLPVSDATFDLVLNRHGYLNLREISRVLRPGGRFLTQQVGPHNDAEFNEALGSPLVADSAPSGLQKLVEDLETAGLTVTNAQEANVEVRYLDVGAVVFQLRAVPWQVPDFDVARHRRHLERIHEQILDQGAFEVHSQRFLVQAHK